MNYKILIVHYSDNDVSPEILGIDIDNGFKAIPYNKKISIEKQWENQEGWFNLKLFGIHLFETDDIKGFDLMEAQRQKDSSLTSINQSVELQNIKTTIDDLDFKIRRKQEVKRVAELFCTAPDCVNLESSVRNAIYFVDNFDAEFEKSQGEK